VYVGRSVGCELSIGPRESGRRSWSEREHDKRRHSVRKTMEWESATDSTLDGEVS